MGRRDGNASHMLNDVILFRGEGADQRRRKRRLRKMAPICSAHHYSAKQSQLLRLDPGQHGPLIPTIQISVLRDKFEKIRRRNGWERGRFFFFFF